MSDLADRLNRVLAGRYAIQRELRSGGMATVFLAGDLKHRRRVAIKVLDPELSAVIGGDRFLREIEVAAGLNHPHILPLHDSGAAEGLLYYVMPFAEGESLRQRLERERQLPLAEAVRIAGEVAGALDYAHRHSVVHRDIKPENILLQDGHAVVADFGIARALVAAGGEQLTATGVAIGTPAYMSPEQCAGSLELDGRSDQYSLGCVLYEMLAGQPPFTGPTAESLIHQHLSVAPRAVRELRPTVPEVVARAIDRAMAKAAADRFRTAAEFAAALTAPETPAPVLAASVGDGAHDADWDASRRRMEVATTISLGARRPRRGIVLAAGVVALIGLAVWRYGPWLGRGAPAAPAKKAWILVAEFDGPAADSSLVTATRDLVMAGLDQSEIVAVVPAEQIQVALQMAGKPGSSRLDVGLARELAYRSAVRTVLEGRIGRLGKGYSLVVRLVDADSGRVVVSVSDVASDEQALIPTLDRITRKLRAALGERRDAIQATHELMENVTPSLEAVRINQRATELNVQGDHRAAIAVDRSALALDPDFAGAWLTIASSFGNLGEADSAIHAYREALARPGRLDEKWQLRCKAALAEWSGDNAGALALSERHVLLYPEHFPAYLHRGHYLFRAGRLPEALESYRMAERVRPFGPTPVLLGHQLRALLTLGRIDEARQVARRLTGRPALGAPMWIAVAAGQWPAAESLATTLRANPAASEELRLDAEWMLAAAQAAHGQARAAERTLRLVQSEAEALRIPLLANRARWRRLQLALFSRGIAAVPGSPGPWDSTTTGLVTRGAWAAATGEIPSARRLLATIRTRSALDLARQGFLPAWLQGWIAAREDRWQEVVTSLGPAALQGEPVGYVEFQSAPLVRWLVAEAYERLGRPDSAAAYFERAIAPPPAGGYDFAHIRMASSFGHRRLVMLYARMGRVEEARRHWLAFSEAFAHSDAELAPLVEEARTALAGAKGMAKSSRLGRSPFPRVVATERVARAQLAWYRPSSPNEPWSGECRPSQ